jgi:hypothetical protein
MMESAFTWLKSFKDPLRNGDAMARWIAAIPDGDPMQIREAALELVAGFPGPRTDVDPPQVDALLRIDARLEPVIAQLTAQYAHDHQQSSGVETRLWHSVFDLVKAFSAAYQAALKDGYPYADTKRWRALLPWVLVRLAHYKGIDGKFRLFRYGRWIPAQWREFHDLYDFARVRGWQREQLVFGGGTFSRAGVCVEQEYLKALMLMRLDSGNFTPDQVEWVARQLDDWTPSLVLVPPPGTGATFNVDLTGKDGLQRQAHRQPSGRSLFLDTTPVYARVAERMRWLPEQDEDVPKPGDLPVREQRLLLMRLASLFGPDAIATTPRAPRVTTDAEVRVVSGLVAIARAIAEVERLPEGARKMGVAGSYDEITQAMMPDANPESVARRLRGAMWQMVDRSETGCRLTAPALDAPRRLGELVAIRDGDAWLLAAVRRMQRQEVDEVTVGVEILSRRVVRVLLRNWVTPAGGGRGTPERPFFGIYLPAGSDNRRSNQRSLIGPDDRFVPGGMVELDTGEGRYLIRFTQTLERQPGWTWALFSAVRKLSS